MAKSARGSATPFVNYLFAARASSELGDTKSVNAFLQKAEKSGDEASIAIGLTQAELQIQNGQYEQALATLLRVRQATGNHPLAARLLAKVYIALGDWQSLLKLLPSLGEDAVDREQVVQMESKACAELIAQAARDGDLQALNSAWKQLPNHARRRPATIAVYIQALLRGGFSAEAESVVRSQLQRDFSSEMAELYGMTQDEKPEKQYAFAERLLKSHQNDPSLLLTMGRLSVRSGRNDEATNYFEQSLEQKQSAAAYAELANLAMQQGDFKSSSRLYASAARLRGGVLTPVLDHQDDKNPAKEDKVSK